MSAHEFDLVEVICPGCGAIHYRHERVVRGFALVRCLGCDLVFANPQPSADGLARLYRDRPGAQGLDRYYAEAVSPVVLAGYDRKLARLARLLGGTGRLLDFGCGAVTVQTPTPNCASQNDESVCYGRRQPETGGGSERLRGAGYLVERAAGQGWDAHGVELGHWAAQAAAARGVTSIHIGELEQMEFLPGSFDLVWTSQVLEHLPLPLEQLSSLRRLLRPGGLLYVDVPNYRTLPALLNREDWYMNHPPQHLNYFTAGSLRRLLSRAGFSVLAIASEGGLKWERLLGRQVDNSAKSPMAPTARGPALAGVGRQSAPTRQSQGLGRYPSALVNGLDQAARHLLYDLLRLGIVLTVIARRP